MYLRFSYVSLIISLIVAWLPWPTAGGQDLSERSVPDLSKITPSRAKVPAGVILVKGAWASASDSVTPVPEAGNVAHGVFSNPYFGITYFLPAGWTEKYQGPPPSDSGRYVLAELAPADTSRGRARGSILITAQDMFFTPVPASNAAELIHYMKENLQADYKVEIPPTQTRIAGHSFTFFAYWSPAAELHWYVLATGVRCHAVQVTFASRDSKTLEGLMADMSKMKLPAEASTTGEAGGGAAPVCIQDYARDENMIARVNPVFAEHRFNPVPVRIIIDKHGRVRHIHFLSAFPDQTKAITDALGQWKFKPHRRDGQLVEVETGIVFGRAPNRELRPAGSDLPRKVSPCSSCHDTTGAFAGRTAGTLSGRAGVYEVTALASYVPGGAVTSRAERPLPSIAAGASGWERRRAGFW